MKLIPVIDLLDGHVVHAKNGTRKHYQPVNSALCKSSQPIQVINDFLSLYAFDTIYIADLNSIMKTGQNNNFIVNLLNHFPNITFWLDQGSWATQTLANQKIIPIIGTESLNPETTIENTLFSHCPPFILSLDFYNDQPLGPAPLFQKPLLWPATVIAMTLDRIGGQRGPDFNKLTMLQEQRPDINLVAAGGIRSLVDLEQLQQRNIHTALIASALHNQQLDGRIISQLARY
ncbi:MAG TPA: nickel transporter [Methylococcaceae bacterium]|nr:nickel transporter [Methylococcaceae bacterium]HIA45347.1 nickel transporter [Methylococcaceae bacterium]HIN68436.1 nickel transporter [Methylococcales bacterium]HIO44194.1 nickel transporter [Methylococcales bacterium]